MKELPWRVQQNPDLVRYVVVDSHLSWVISQKEKMCMENDFNNFFQVVSGQLKSRVLKKSFEGFLKKCDLKLFTL